MFQRLNKLFLIFLLGLAFNSLPNIATERNLMIFWDCDWGEALFMRSQIAANLIGPITMEALTALYQEPGALLLSTHTLINILTIGKFFTDCLNKDIEDLKKQYSSSQGLFSIDDYFEDLKKNCEYVNNNYHKLNGLLQSSSTQEELYSKIKNDPFFDWEVASKFLDRESATIYLMCAYLPFDRFIIKKLGTEGYLFIPYSYLKKLGIDHNLLKKNDGFIDDLEIKLGLKINHLSDVKINAQEILDLKGFMPKNCRQFLLTALDTIFVKNHDIKDTLPKPWAIYWTSHGMFNPQFPETLKRLKVDRAALKEKQKILAETKQSSPEIFSIENEVLNLKFNIWNLRLLKYSLKPKVAGLTLKQFKQILKFLNQKITTGFLFYTSCFAGGQLALYAYKNETQNKLSSYNFPIATDSSFDVPTRKEIITKPLSSYVNKKEGKFNRKRLNKIINFDEKRVVLHSNLNYVNFFNQLEKFPIRSTSYLELFTNINPLLANFEVQLRNKYWVQALPSMRIPGTTWFNTIQLPKKVVLLTKVRTLARGNTPLIIDQDTNKKDAILLYTKNIPFEISITRSSNTSFPSIVSMNPGPAIHILESLNAPDFDISETLRSFYPFEVFTGTKLFHIKKLTARAPEKLRTMNDKSYDFHDVMVVFNGKLEENEDQFSNFIFFRGPKATYIYQWRATTPLPSDFMDDIEINRHFGYRDLLLKYFAAHEPILLDEEKFSGILETTQGSENVDLDALKTLLENKAKLLKESKLQDKITQLKLLAQSLTNLGSQLSKPILNV